MASLQELQRRRERECRLTPDRALADLDEAEAFLRDRGLLTLTASCSLPSLFGACHEEPYSDHARGFGAWPKTKWRWGFALEERPGVLYTKLLRGTGLFLSAEAAELADPLCRAELARAESGGYGDSAVRLVEHLAEAGPTLVEDVRTELGLEPKAVRRLRKVLERVGAVVARGMRLEEGEGRILHRWDQVRPEPSDGGGVADLVVAGVRAAVVAPEREAARWLPWPAPIEELVEKGRLVRPEPGWLAAP